MTDSSLINLPIRQSQVPEILRPKIEEYAYSNPTKMILVMSNHLVNKTPWFIPLKRFALQLPKQDVYAGLGFNGNPSTTYVSHRANISVQTAHMPTDQMGQLYLTIRDHIQAMIENLQYPFKSTEYKNKGFLCFQQDGRWSIEAELHGLVITDLSDVSLGFDQNICFNVKFIYDYAEPYLPSYKHPVDMLSPPNLMLE